MFDDDVLRLRKQVKALHRRLLRELPEVDGLTRTELQVLVTVERAPTPLRPGQLAAELQMTGSNVAAALRTLEALGMVDRRTDPADGRKAFVTVTERGSDAVAEVRRSHNTWLRETVKEVLTEEEQRLLFQAGDLLQRLADHGTTPLNGHTQNARRAGGDYPDRERLPNRG